MLFTCGRNGKRCRKSKVHWCMCRHGECKFILHGSTISTFLYQLMQLCPSAFRCQLSLINSHSECYLFRFSLIKYLWPWFPPIMVGNQTWDDCAGQMTEGLWTENNMEIVVGYTTESQKAVWPSLFFLTFTSQILATLQWFLQSLTTTATKCHLVNISVPALFGKSNLCASSVLRWSSMFWNLKTMIKCWAFLCAS